MRSSKPKGAVLCPPQLTQCRELLDTGLSGRQQRTSRTLMDISRRVDTKFRALMQSRGYHASVTFDHDSNKLVTRVCARLLCTPRRVACAVAAVAVR